MVQAQLQLSQYAHEILTITAFSLTIFFQTKASSAGEINLCLNDAEQYAVIVNSKEDCLEDESWMKKFLVMLVFRSILRLQSGSASRERGRKGFRQRHAYRFLLNCKTNKQTNKQK